MADFRARPLNISTRDGSTTRTRPPLGRGRQQRHHLPVFGAASSTPSRTIKRPSATFARQIRTQRQPPRLLGHTRCICEMGAEDDLPPFQMGGAWWFPAWARSEVPFLGAHGLPGPARHHALVLLAAVPSRALACCRRGLVHHGHVRLHAKDASSRSTVFTTWPLVWYTETSGTLIFRYF